MAIYDATFSPEFFHTNVDLDYILHFPVYFFHFLHKSNTYM